ncbi:hypothetical protein LX03_03340 [Limosilactobacillus mucosae]|uniref:Uncharacterized protein n=1 Tax=Limosilactobacillus mucosae TaxID=97478 RepID=A0A099YE06_LIMMU|nr:hypothetical protein LX03_03340 [Limosilactobacillus mucosae]
MLYEEINHDPKCPLVQEQKAELVTLGTGYTREEKTGTYTLDDQRQLKKMWGKYKKRVGLTDFNVYADGFALIEGSSPLQTWMHLPRCPLCGKETHLQKPSEIIEEHFSRFNNVSFKSTDVDTYEVSGEDMQAELYRSNDDKWLLNIGELFVDSPAKLTNILPIFDKVMGDLNDYQEYKKVVKKVWNITI